MQPEAERDRILREFTDEEIEREFIYNWGFWARTSQLAPPGDWLCWLLLAGRGFGKTRAGTEWVTSWAYGNPGGHIAIIGETKADVRDVLVEKGESSLIEVAPPWLKPIYEPSKRRVTWPNGAYGTLYSGDEPDQLRGPQHGAALVDEIAKYKYPTEAWDNLEFGLRAGDNPKVVVATTPRPIPIIKMLLADSGTVVTRGSTFENVHNLAPSFIKRVVGRYEGTRLGRQELHAEILDDNPHALWHRDEMIEALRVTVTPPFIRVVVGVDPSGAATAAECGIVVGGLGTNGHGYILADKSRKGTPSEWGTEVVAAYNLHDADRVIGEANYGGEMVENTIRAVQGGQLIAYKAVHASRGKQLRAEPVAALYEQKKIHHVGAHPLLEDELCNWEPGMPSPNRMDALVWALTELFLGKQKKRAGAWG